MKTHPLTPWLIVQQPDGKFARFSTIVDDFTHLSMDFDEAVECGIHDEDSEGNEGDGLHRWRDALRTIAIAHGGGKARQRAWQVRKAARNAGA